MDITMRGEPDSYGMVISTECARRAYSWLRRWGFDDSTCRDVISESLKRFIKAGGRALEPAERCRRFWGYMNNVALEVARRCKRTILVEDAEENSAERQSSDPLTMLKWNRLYRLIDIATIRLTDNPQRLRSVFLICPSDQKKDGNDGVAQYMGRLPIPMMDGQRLRLHPEVAEILGDLSKGTIIPYSTQAQSQFSLLLKMESDEDDYFGDKEANFRDISTAKGTPNPVPMADGTKQALALFLRATAAMQVAERVAFTLVHWCRSRMSVAEKYLAQLDGAPSVRSALGASVKSRVLEEATRLAGQDDFFALLNSDELQSALEREYDQCLGVTH